MYVYLIMYTMDFPKFIVSNQGSKFLILHFFNTILIIIASICHFYDFWSICNGATFWHFPLEFTGWTIVVPTLFQTRRKNL